MIAQHCNSLLVAILVVLEVIKAAAGLDVYAYNLHESCIGTPNRVDTGSTSSCSDGCVQGTSIWKSEMHTCDAENYTQVISDMFDGASYLVMETFNDESNCESLIAVSALLASGTCEQIIMYVKAWGFAVYEIIQLEEEGSVSVRYYTDDACTTPLNGSVAITTDAQVQDIDVHLDSLNSSSCDASGYRYTYYEGTLTSSNSFIGSASNAATDDLSSMSNTTDSDTKTSGIVEIVGGVLAAAVLITLGFIVYRWQFKSNNKKASHGRVKVNVKVDIPIAEVQGQSGLWEDDVITAKRIA